ncbi:MAG: geranylgeranyl reductase family protein [Acidiferrobacter sp.]
MTVAPTAFDVLIVGLGPAGAAAAAVAARAGLSVLAIDRRRQLGVPVQCAEFVPLPMGRYARSALVQRITRMRSILPSGAMEHSAFPGLMIDRAAFDQALATEASRHGALLRVQTTLKTLTADEALLRVADGEVERARYQVLIAADGPHSTVARCVGLAPLTVVDTRQYSLPLLKPYTDTDIWLSDDYPGGYAWCFPKGAVANVGVGADRHLLGDLKAPLSALCATLARDGLIGRDILSRTGGAIPVSGMRTSLIHENILFVGDAAGLTHPITGAGIASAVQSGERAGRAAAEWIGGRGRAFEDFEEDIRDTFEDSLTRAVARRRWLMARWHTPSARADATHKRGWVAFPDYFAG